MREPVDLLRQNHLHPFTSFMTDHTASAPGSTAAPLKILLVDDELCIRQIFADLFRAEGHRCATAANGYEALEKFETEPWDVVLTDRAMPGMDGEQLAREIKNRAPATPVILITGYAAGAQDNDAIDAIVPKPFTRQALWEVISGCLAARPAGLEEAA